MNNRGFVRWAEAIVAGFLVSALGLLRPGDPAFAGLGFYPQALCSVVVAALLGVGPGIAACAAAALSSWLCPLGASALGLSVSPTLPADLFEAARFPFALTIAGVAASGALRDAAERRERKLMGRFRELVHRDYRLSRITDTLVFLNDELETKVSNQRESVSTLYSRVRKMDTPLLKDCLFGLLDAVRYFAQADKASVYEYNRKTRTLVLRAWRGAKPPKILSAEESIEGWVYRNGSAFSLRMLDAQPNLRRLDERRSILAFPLRSGELPWGVLNIEEMTFFRYTPTTEKNIEIIVALAASYIKKAVEFRERVVRRPRNEVTGLPGYVELSRLLDEEFSRRKVTRASLSVVLLELLDFEKLIYAHSGAKALGLMGEIARASNREGHLLAFHYKEESQIAFIMPGLDRDGAALFCLETAGIIDAGTWKLDEAAVRLEPAFGIASAGVGGDARALLEEAERVLGLSRSAAAFRGEDRASS